MFIYNEVEDFFMEINLIRIRTILNSKEKEIVEANDAFINTINDELVDDDLSLCEDSLHAAYDIYFIETGGSETKFLDYFNKGIKAPVILLSNGKNNSLPACLEIKTFCANNDVPAIILTGNEQRIALMIKTFSKAIIAKNMMEENNLALVGEPSDWLIASKISDEDAYRIFKIHLVHISMEEFAEEINKNELVKIPHLNEIKEKHPDDKVLEGALNIYSALKRLINKYDLKGLTVRCFDLLSIYKNTACLALALLNEEGITATCEGDVPSLLTMHALRALTGRSSFQANPSYINQENKTVLFAHCTVPLNMISDYELPTHFESDLGIGIQGELHPGDVTVCKLYVNKKGNLDNSVAFSGTIKENLSLKGYCRTQVNVEFSEYDLMNILSEDFGNHMILCYGDITNEFYSLLSLLNGASKKEE